LAWRYFHQSEAPKLLRHIEDRDLWKWEMEHTDEVLLGLDSNEQSVEVYDRYADKPERLLQSGTAIASYRDKLVGRLIEKATIREAEVDGETYTFGIVNSPLLQSEIGEQIQEEHPEVDVALIFFLEDLAEGTVVGASLRSVDEGPDVGDLATFLGGGGHANSAGFGTTTEDFTLADSPQQLVLLD
jgi:oligoribonuclease NrnB/cAMP/cGMP phosphodiesterase (DHH superfamily)